MRALHPVQGINSKAGDESPASGETQGAHDEKLALDLHRRFLQEVLAEIMPILSEGERSPERLKRALEAYWEACFARRAIRKKVVALAGETLLTTSVEPLGRPFFHMILSELWALDPASSNARAAAIYNEGRAVAVSEANFDKRMPSLREAVVQNITAGNLKAA